MSTHWDENSVTSPLTLIVSAFARVPNVHTFVTPALCRDDSVLLLLSLGSERRLGGSTAAQVYSRLGGVPPDVDDPLRLKALFELVQRHLDDGSILSMHDRSDGGVFVTVVEQAIAGRIGLELSCEDHWFPFLFNEEVGVVIETSHDKVNRLEREAKEVGLALTLIGHTAPHKRIVVRDESQVILDRSLVELEEIWSRTSFEMQRRRDNPASAKEEWSLIDARDDGLAERLTFEPDSVPVITSAKPLVAVLRDQGINGQLEMAAAFRAAGFEAVDVHMTDLFDGREALERFQVLVACGGFSYGDVLGGGGGWAKSILYSSDLREQFSAFFERDTLTLGICNGCQMLAQLRDLIPGADSWVTWAPNLSGRFEGRTVQVRINNVNTPWLEGMGGSQIPVPVAHGEGRANCTNSDEAEKLIQSNLVALQYVDGGGQVTEHYPLNPNGSALGIAGLVSSTGRALIAMPHPERVFRAMQQTWRTPLTRRTKQYSGWVRLFQNAYRAIT